MLKTLLSIVGLGLVACGGGGGASSALEGVYTASAWTENATGCDAEGPSVLESQSQVTFYLKVETFFGESFLNLNFCDDLAACTELATDAETIHIGRFAFEGSDGAGWTFGSYRGFAPEGGTCDGDYVVGTLSSPEAGVVRVEQRSTPAGGFAPDADGFCDDADGAQAAEGQPCGSLEVFTASSIGSF